MQIAFAPDYFFTFRSLFFFRIKFFTHRKLQSANKFFCCGGKNCETFCALIYGDDAGLEKGRV